MPDKLDVHHSIVRGSIHERDDISVFQNARVSQIREEWRSFARPSIFAYLEEQNNRDSKFLGEIFKKPSGRGSVRARFHASDSQKLKIVQHHQAESLTEFLSNALAFFVYRLRT